MRRKDREVTNLETMHEIMSNCICCRIGFYDDGEVYIVPLNFGFIRENNETTLYFHGAKEGRKIELMKKCANVGFEMDTSYELKGGDEACDYTAKFQSIIGTGEISIVKSKEEKILGLETIMYQSTKKSNWEFNEKMVDATCIFKIKIKKMSCKDHE